ncbi:radical SAM protein [Loktanella sp. DJP18]|uniref:radical SAM protein n=1 Tax=Loktanella sp. DJP18 TaxID=3409788 RepID=UPI003BB601A6
MPATEINSIDEFSRDKFVFSDMREKALYLLRDTSYLNISNHEMIAVSQVLRNYGVGDVMVEARGMELPIEDQTSMQFHRFQAGGVGFADWLDFMLSDNITIYGYDDNYDRPSTALTAAGVAIELGSDLTWKKDGAAIVGYQPNNGTKVRWSREPYTKSETPELVDVKITDFCGYGCTFCYQGSTKAGMHAPLARIERIFDQLSAMNVFEVAIGGGEPAHHPDFAKIIAAATARKLTFNFTAYGLDWLKDDAVLDALKAARGNGVGISVHSRKDLIKVARVQEKLIEKAIYSLSAMAQTVVGATPMTIISEMLEACISERNPLLLLGFKDTGRGATFGKSKPSDDAIKKLLVRAKEATETTQASWRNFQLSVDTAFLDQYGHILDELNVPHSLRTSPDGKFSMYIDAVENTCGPSSYCDPGLMVPVDNLHAQFATF